MLPILEFVFSSFWVWAGTAVLVMIIGACAAAGASRIRLVSWSYNIHPERKLLRQLIKEELKDKISEEVLKHVVRITDLMESKSKE